MARNKVSPARWSAFEILKRVNDGGFSSNLLAEYEPKLEPADRALCHELALGVLRRQLNLDKTIEHFSNRKIESLDLSVLLALRLGLYQLRFLTRIPASAAVDESVKIVQTARLSSARAFVNAVLRRATREPNYDPAANISDPIARMAIETSHPEWLLKRWLDLIGFEETEKLAKANNETPRLSFRVVTGRASEAEILERLQAAGIEIERSNLTKSAFSANSGSRILRELAERGEIYLQDEASQLVAEVVGANDGDVVLDLCAAPGGKTTLIASQGSATRVIAVDISERRLLTVASAIEKQNVKNVSLIQLDATQRLPFAEGSFDRVLVDAPCSGTGTLRHNPEIRWRVTIEDIHRLADQQNQILMNAARLLKRGGRLVYSTCSVEAEENEEVLRRFVTGTGDFEQIALENSAAAVSASGSLRTWPQRQGTDGFFIAAFRRR